MPKGIRKPTIASIKTDIDKQLRQIHDKELAILKAKADYDAKVKRLKREISEGKARSLKLRREYDALVQNEQRDTMTTLLFNGNLSSDEITKALNAMRMLLNGNADHEKALQMLQEIANRQQNSTITHLVSAIEAKEAQSPRKTDKGLGIPPQSAEQAP